MKDCADSSSGFEHRALERLREAGCRITMPRVQVIRVLAEADRALNAYAIHERVTGGGGRMDIVSVYRTLDTLMEHGLVHHLGVVNGYLACGLEDHHHSVSEHLVCRSCGAVREIAPERADDVEAHPAWTSGGFSPIEVKIEVLGLCRACRAS